MKKTYCLTVIFACITQCIEPAIIAKGNSTTTPFGFNVSVTTRALDPYTGIFYVGLNGDTSAYNLSKIGRYVGQSSPAFTGFAPTILQNTIINYLTLSSPENAPANLVGSDEVNLKQVFITKNDGSSASHTNSNLNDASGSATTNVAGVAASSQHIVAAVTANSSGTYGVLDSGLALIAIDSNLGLHIKDATTGLSGNLAIKLDNTSPIFKGGGADNVTITDIAPQIIYDKPLNLFYIGASMSTGVTNGDIAKSVAIAYIDATANNNIALTSIAPDGAIDVNDNQIILTIVQSATQDNLSIKKLGILHASTGPSYLIVAGDNGTTPLNNVYALPLVDTPLAPSTHGTLARKDSALMNGKFTVAATTPAETALSTDPAAFIGSSSLPISSSNTISDMMVIGDTVYVSINISPDIDNEPGIFYSQALFDNTGKIVGWTTWTKKILPLDAFPNILLPNGDDFNGQVALFQVDIVNGKVWFVDGITSEVVGTTAWKAPNNAALKSLAYQLNSTIPNGAQVVLDLDQSTHGINDTTVARYALFGGSNKIAFARTSIAFNASIDSPQTPITDFTDPENFLLTILPSGAGCCQTLEYARRIEADVAQNYFFAGTSNGLYVFANASTKDGFTISNTVNALNATPFSDGAWFLAENIPGSIIALKTTGTTLYIIAQEQLTTTLYRVDFTTNISTMFASSNISILAQTGNATFQDIRFLYDIGIISIASGGPGEQLVLATNNGLFASATIGGVQSATSDATALWTQLNASTLSQPFIGITSPDNAPIDATVSTGIRPTTVWPFGLVDLTNNGLFNKSKLYQVAGNATNAIGNVPIDFTNKDSATAFNALYPITHFFTDGARRFFVINSPFNYFGGNNLMILPFDTTTWRVTTQAQAIIPDPQLQTIQSIYWIHQIGATGTILMGTNKGVYTLD